MPSPRPLQAQADPRRAGGVLWIDRQEFEREAQSALALCAAALARDDVSVDAAEHAAERALALYRGPFLGGDRDLDWAQPARDRCAHLWASLTCRLSALMAVRDQEYERAVLLLERLVETQPDDEQAVALLMLVQATGGHRGEALRTYEVLRSRLKRDFGMLPEPELEMVATTVRTGISRDRLVALLAARATGPLDQSDDLEPLDLRELASLALAT